MGRKLHARNDILHAIKIRLTPLRSSIADWYRRQFKCMPHPKSIHYAMNTVFFTRIWEPFAHSAHMYADADAIKSLTMVYRNMLNRNRSVQCAIVRYTAHNCLAMSYVNANTHISCDVNPSASSEHSNGLECVASWVRYTDALPISFAVFICTNSIWIDGIYSLGIMQMDWGLKRIGCNVFVSIVTIIGPFCNPYTELCGVHMPLIFPHYINFRVKFRQPCLNCSLAVR